MKKNVLFCSLVAGLFSLTEIAGKKKEPPVDLWPVEASVQRLFKEIEETKDDSLALQKHERIKDILAETLAHPAAYKYKFDSLRAVGKIDAPRRKFRIFNWNHSFRDGTHRHFALIVIPDKKDSPCKVIGLTDRSDSVAKPDSRVLGPDEWFGALYYKIIPQRKGKDKRAYYTLLGTDMNNLKTKKKIVEILSFDKNGNPQFGAPVIELNGWTKNRIVFEFAATQYMYLEYNRFRRRIEFDHLSPLMPYLVGEYEYYEPDLYRDGLKFRRGRWKHYKDIEEPPKDKKPKKRTPPKPPRRIMSPKPAEAEADEKDRTEETSPASRIEKVGE